MPRRSSRAPAERKSTRGAVAEAAAADDIEDPPAEPKPSRKSKKSVSPAPALTSPRPSRAAKSRAKKVESDSEIDEEGSADEDEYSPAAKGRGKAPAKSPRGRGRGTPKGRGKAAAGRGRGRGKGKAGKKKERTPSDSEDEEEIMEEQPAKELVTPSRSSKRTRTSRSSVTSPPDPTEPSPKRRSSRGASQAATAAIKETSQDEMEDEEGQEEEEGDAGSRGMKRKAGEEEEEYSPVKDKESKKESKRARKTDEDESKETVEDADLAAQGDAPPAKTKASPKKKEPETKKEEEESESEEKEPEPKEEKNKTIPEEPKKEEVKDVEKEEKVIKSDAKVEEAEAKQSPVKESVPETSAEPAKAPEPEQVSKPVESSKPEPVAEVTKPAEESKAAETTPEKPFEKSVSEGKPAQEADTDEKDFVVVEKADVPAHESNEVQQSLPPKPAPVAAPPAPVAAPPAPVAAPPAPVAAPPAPVASPPAPVAAPPAPVAAPPAPVAAPPAPVPAPAPAPAPVAAPAPAPVPVAAPAPVPVHNNAVPSNPPPVVAAAPVLNNIESKANGTATMNNVGNNQSPPPTVPAGVDPLLNRKYIASKDCATHTDVNKHFTIASYNILASCHAVRCKQDGMYGWSTEDQLTMEARHARIREELQYLAADVLCLQEVEPEYFERVLVPELKVRGYEGKFFKRLGDCNEGEATFYRTSRFTLEESKGIALRELAFKELESASLEEDIKAAVRKVITEKSGSVVLLTKLKCVNTNASLSVANIHVSWGKLKTPDIQCVEVACAIKELVTIASGTQNPHIICGDFNSPPGSPAHQLTLEGYLNDETMAKLQALDNVPTAEGKTSSLVNLWWKGFQHTSTSLKSTYSVITGADPMSSKFPHDGVVRAVDYQWYNSAAIVPLGVLQAVDASLIQDGIPNATFPSDHLSTKARFTFV